MFAGGASCNALLALRLHLLCLCWLLLFGSICLERLRRRPLVSQRREEGAEDGPTPAWMACCCCLTLLMSRIRLLFVVRLGQGVAVGMLMRRRHVDKLDTVAVPGRSCFTVPANSPASMCSEHLSFLCCLLLQKKCVPWLRACATRRRDRQPGAHDLSDLVLLQPSRFTSCPCC